MNHKNFFEFVRGRGYRSILALNGNGLDVAKELNLPIIAVDGAANTLFDKGVPLQLIVGDLDSVRDDVRQKNKTVHLPDQDTSDFQKALKVVAELDLLPAIILGINGGYLDHILNNINTFFDSGCLFYDPPIVGLLLDRLHEFQLPAHTKVSLFGMPKATVTTSGFKWDIENAHLAFCGSNSCFNRTESEVVTVNVQDGKVLAMIYLEPIDDAGL